MARGKINKEKQEALFDASSKEEVSVQHDSTEKSTVMSHPERTIPSTISEKPMLYGGLTIDELVVKIEEFSRIHGAEHCETEGWNAVSRIDFTDEKADFIKVLSGLKEMVEKHELRVSASISCFFDSGKFRFSLVVGLPGKLSPAVLKNA